MKWHLTEEELQGIQRQDEADFKTRFERVGYAVRKLDVNSERKNPDFELEKDGQKVIIELKSKFQNDSYNRIASVFTDRISKIKFNYNYQFVHFYKTMPTEVEIREQLKLIRIELSSLTFDLKLPYALRLGDYGHEAVHRRLIELNPNRKEFEEKRINEHYSHFGNGKIAVTLDNRNKLGHLNCWMLIGDSQDNLLIIIKDYIEGTLGNAKTQLADYIGKTPIGVFYYNHMPFNWDDYNIISLYGDLKVAFSTNPLHKEASIFLGENKVIREDRKQWLSFIGFINYGIDPFYWIYRNGFSDLSLNKEYFKSENVKVRSIVLSKDGSSIAVEE
jgi:hypothetical protein